MIQAYKAEQIAKWCAFYALALYVYAKARRDITREINRRIDSHERFEHREDDELL